VEGVELAEPIRRSGYRRLSQERRYGRELARRLAGFDPELVISANAPLEVQLRVLSAARAGGAAFVFWVQDLHGVAITRILGRRYPLIGNLIGQRFARLESQLFRDSDAIVAISSDYLPPILGSGVDEDHVSVVENWAPLDVEPDPAGSAAWARSHGLGPAPVILYAGTLALKHNPALLLDLASGLPQATVVAVTEGPGAEWLREHGSHLDNLRLLPQQPYGDLGDMLGAADLLLVVLEPDASTFSVPSKVLTYLVAGRPILAAVPAENRAARMLKEAGAGRVVMPTDARGLVSAAREMLADSDELRRSAAAGRAYAVKTFAIDPITDRFEAIFYEALDRKSHSSSPGAADTEPRD
jgi:glycosyltransferase involved in cell wall biosynthesis